MFDHAAANSQPRVLVLWDVDHTLIETRGVGRAVFEQAFLAAAGVPLTNRADISGRTELDIMRESLRINGVEPTDERVELVAKALVQGYEEARGDLGLTGRALPGSRDVLAELAEDAAIYQTVLTGNLRQVARIKLEVFGLDAFLELAAGAYGDDHADRPELVAIAQGRASARTGSRFGTSNTVLIGDTPKDVAAGLAAGVPVIGVATGKTTRVELVKAGASEVLEGLDNASGLQRILARFSD